MIKKCQQCTRIKQKILIKCYYIKCKRNLFCVVGVFPFAQGRDPCYFIYQILGSQIKCATNNIDMQKPQIQTNFKYQFNTFPLMQRSLPNLLTVSTGQPTQGKGYLAQGLQPQIKPSNSAQIYKKMSEFKNTAPGINHNYTNGDSIKGGIKSEAVKENYLCALERQIEALEVNHSRQTCLRYEAEAFILRKKRTNLFRVNDRNFSTSSQGTKNGANSHFNIQITDKKPVNKNSIKLYKIIRSFFEYGSQEQADHRHLNFISYKHKFSLPENIKIQQNSHYYGQGEIRRIKKYQNNLNCLPSLGVTFDYENKQDDSELEKNTENSKDFYQEDINCFDERPEASDYILPEHQLFKQFLTRNKKQLFKGSKLINRMKIEKQSAMKRLAYLCVRQVDKRYKKCLKNQSDYINRAKKIHREGLLYWRKRDKQLAELKKKKEKIEADIKKRNQQKQQEQTQKKKLQYLMKQSVLYSHFMAKKLGMETENKDILNDPDKPVDIDEQAAELNVNQMISKKLDNLQKFDEAEGLDFSKVQVQQYQADITGPPPIFHGKLKDYQVKGLKWLYNLNLQGINGILADEMGLGKTIQAIALLSHISYTKNKWGPFLIVSPSSTLHNWQQQFKRFCPCLKILPYWGGIKQRKVIRKNFSTKKFTSKHDSPFHVVITSYQMAVTDEKTFRRLKWQFIVLDQAHNIKNTMSQRWNVLKQFQSRSRLLLTGTPIQNNMAELWALLNFIMPELFDSHEQFNEWFSKDIEAHSQDQKQLDKIQIQRLHAILKPFMLRRVKKDVEHEIGKKYEHRILCEMTKRQKLLYDSIKQKLNVKQLFKMIESKAKVQNLMNLVMQLRKVCNHPELFERRPPLSPFMFQQVYYYTGFTPIRGGDIKLLSFSSVNPITYNLPKLVYQGLTRYQQNHQTRNKRILNIFEPQNLMKSSNFQFLSMLGLSWGEIQNCFKQDQLLTSILLLHWMKKNNYSSKFSTKEYLYFDYNRFDNVDRRFFFDKKANLFGQLSQIFIPTAIAPTIQPTISSECFYNDLELQANNKYQKFIFEGKFKQKWGKIIPDQQFDGILPKEEFLTKIQLVNFGSLVADSAKLTQLDRILKQKRDKGDKVLIFCQMTKMLDILEDFMNMRKYPFFRLDGACSLSDRRDMVNQFQRQSSKVFVFLLSTRAGGLGVTLTAANNVVFYDNDWNPTMDAQATDRAHRIGQTRDVYVYQLVTKNTIQDRIVKRAEQKKTVQSTVYEGGSLNIFKKDIMQLMADELGVQPGQELKKDEPTNNANNNNKKRGPKQVKPPIGKTRQKQKTF